MADKPKVLLVDPVSREGQSYEGSGAALPGPNMGLISLATYLKRYGVPVTIVDMAAEVMSPQTLVLYITHEKPDIVGFSAKTFNITAVYDLAEAIKSVSPSTMIVLGGSHGQALPEQTLKECGCIDAIALGEGELALLDIATNHPLVTSARGVAYSHDGTVITTPVALIPDLNELPDPNFSFVDYDNYGGRRNPKTDKIEVRYPIFHARGCPFNCAFCMSPRNYRMFKTSRILSIIERLHDQEGIEYIFFEDSTFLPAEKDFRNFCDAYVASGLSSKVAWGFGTRINVTFPGMFELAKEAGCVQVGFGIESGSEEVLRHNNKHYPKDMIRRAVSEAWDAGIEQVRGFFIIGLPYDTRETIEETVQLIEELPMHNFGLGILDVYPGTEAWDMTERGEGGLQWLPGRRMNWDSYSRNTVQASVNGIGEDELLQLRDSALKRGRSAARARLNQGTVGITTGRAKRMPSMLRLLARRILRP